MTGSRPNRLQTGTGGESEVQMGKTLARTEEASTLNSNEWVQLYKVHG